MPECDVCGSPNGVVRNVPAPAPVSLSYCDRPECGYALAAVCYRHMARDGTNSMWREHKQQAEYFESLPGVAETLEKFKVRRQKPDSN